MRVAPEATLLEAAVLVVTSGLRSRGSECRTWALQGLRTTGSKSKEFRTPKP